MIILPPQVADVFITQWKSGRSSLPNSQFTRFTMVYHLNMFDPIQRPSSFSVETHLPRRRLPADLNIGHALADLSRQMPLPDARECGAMAPLNDLKTSMKLIVKMK